MRTSIVSAIGAGALLAAFAAPAQAHVDLTFGTPGVGARVVVGSPRMYVGTRYDVPFRGRTSNWRSDQGKRQREYRRDVQKAEREYYEDLRKAEREYQRDLEKARREYERELRKAERNRRR